MTCLLLIKTNTNIRTIQTLTQAPPFYRIHATTTTATTTTTTTTQAKGLVENRMHPYVPGNSWVCIFCSFVIEKYYIIIALNDFYT